MNNIFAQIRQEIRDFTNNYIQIVEGYTFNQYQTIKKCHLYYNSKFVSGDIDASGRKKIFKNICKSACKVATRFLNFDTKDIRLINSNPNNEIATLLLEKELKQWMKTNRVAVTLNKIATNAPIYGSVVLKKTKKSAEVVDLRRLFLDPTVESIDKSRFITIEHNLTPTQLRAKAKDGWENVEEVINKFYSNTAPDSYVDQENLNQVVSTPYIKVHERYGEVPESLLNGTEPKQNEPLVRALYIVAGADSVSRNDNGQVTGENGVVLFKSKWFGEYPFKDFHYDQTEGRWLGIGVVEDLFQIQERVNELANQKRTSMEVSSMHLFQTQDRTIVKNVLRDLQNGAVLLAGANGGITPIANEERNFSAYGDEENRYAQQAKENTFSYDAVRGEQLPVSTPATNAVIQDRNAVSVFNFKRQNLANMLRYFFKELVIPQAIRELTPAHIFNFIGTPEELNKLDDILVKSYASKIAIEKILAGEIIDNYEELKQNISDQLKKRGASRYFDIIDGYYKTAEFDFDINVDNEQEDSQLITQNLFSVIQAIASNPMILQDPVIKVLFYEYAEKVGVSPIKLEVASIQASQNNQMNQSIGQLPVGTGSMTPGQAVQPQAPQPVRMQ